MRTLSKHEGIITSLLSGNDSFSLFLSNEEGTTTKFRETPGSSERFSPEEKRELAGIESQMPGKKWPGNYFPTVMDLYSTVRIWFVDSHDDAYLSDEVLKRPPELWITIVACTKGGSEASLQKYRLRDQGFDNYVVESALYKALKPGWFVAISGAFRSKAEAERRCSLSRQKGWNDAYIRRVW